MLTAGSEKTRFKQWIAGEKKGEKVETCLETEQHDPWVSD